jgi:putative ABC transport system permease protein
MAAMAMFLSMDSLLNDLRYALRRLSSTPGFTVVAAMTLALGIGASTSIFSVLDAFLLKPLPYRDPERLAEIWLQHPNGIRTDNLQPATVPEWRSLTTIFEGVAPYRNRSATLTGAAEPISALGAELGGNLMPLLSVAPQLGRWIEEADTRNGQSQVVVLSDQLWRDRFGGDRTVIGRTIRLDDKTYDVIGVMPASFTFPYGKRQFWIPLTDTPATSGRSVLRINLMTRVRSDLSLAEAQSRLDTITSQAGTGSLVPEKTRAQLQPPLARHLNPSVKTALYVLAGAVALVLLIACANLANLLLVQGAARQREIAVRAALGASRPRLVRQLLVETLLIAAVGGLLGVILAQWAIDLIAAYAPPRMTLVDSSAVTLDGRAVLFALGLTLLTAVIVGLLPAFRNSHDLVKRSLQVGGRSATDAPRQDRLRRGFVVLQLAVSLILLVGAGLLMRTFTHLTRIDPGFETRDLLTINLALPHWKYPDLVSQRRFFDDLIERVRPLPGVRAVALTGGVPPDAGGVSFGLEFEIEGQGVVLNDPGVLLPSTEVGPEFFSVMGIPLKGGRTFSAVDGPGAPKTVIISEGMARRLWKGADPIGQRLRLEARSPWLTVVGVVGDVYQLDHAQGRGMFAAYYPLSQDTRVHAQQTVVIRTTGELAKLIPLLKEQIWALDPELPVRRIASIGDQYGDFFAVPRFQAFLLTSFALVGVTIAAVGLYGVLAYAVALRSREFGIRMALGARPADVLRLVLRSAGVVIAAGLALGAGGSVIVTRVLDALLIDIQRTDPLTYVAVTLLLAVVAVSACWIPARRATRVDPVVVALRSE